MAIVPTLNEPTILRIRRLIESAGERRAGEMLNVPRATLMRALAGLGIRRGTVLLLEAALDRVEAEAGK